MATRQALLLIADIGGYTRFMSVHRINLSHAQVHIARLLEAILDAARPFKLAKLEGDAAFLYAPLPGWPADVSHLARAVADIRRAFMVRRARLEAERLCTCDACTQAGQLKLKFVAHAGEVAEQKVRRNRELAGVSVITLHRLLKNHVPVSEYVLMTDTLHAALPEDVRSLARSQPEDLEGLGEVTTHYIDLNQIAVVPESLLRASPFRKLYGWIIMTLRAIPYFVGARTACDGFRNMDLVAGAPMPASLPPPDASGATSNE